MRAPAAAACWGGGGIGYVAPVQEARAARRFPCLLRAAVAEDGAVALQPPNDDGAAHDVRRQPLRRQIRGRRRKHGRDLR